MVALSLLMIRIPASQPDNGLALFKARLVPNLCGASGQRFMFVRVNAWKIRMLTLSEHPDPVAETK